MQTSRFLLVLFLFPIITVSNYNLLGFSSINNNLFAYFLKIFFFKSEPFLRTPLNEIWPDKRPVSKNAARCDDCSDENLHGQRIRPIFNDYVRLHLKLFKQINRKMNRMNKLRFGQRVSRALTFLCPD